MLKYAVALIASATAMKSDVDLIKQGEGLRTCTYKDTMGIKTVCYGFNLERGNARGLVQKAGANYDQLNRVGACTTQAVCDKLLNDEVYNARQIVKSQYGSSIKCKAAEAVVTDLAYNLGSGGLSQFKKFKAAIQSQNWSQAANELNNSAYCRQVGTRCTRNKAQIKEC